MKRHAPHPTQANACGTAATAITITEADFLAAMGDLKWGRKMLCSRCIKVLEAAAAGRPVYAGYDDGHGDTGKRVAK